MTTTTNTGHDLKHGIFKLQPVWTFLLEFKLYFFLSDERFKMNKTTSHSLFTADRMSAEFIVGNIIELVLWRRPQHKFSVDT